MHDVKYIVNILKYELLFCIPSITSPPHLSVLGPLRPSRSLRANYHSPFAPDTAVHSPSLA